MMIPIVKRPLLILFTCVMAITAFSFHWSFDRVAADNDLIEAQRYLNVALKADRAFTNLSQERNDGLLLEGKFGTAANNKQQRLSDNHCEGDCATLLQILLSTDALEDEQFDANNVTSERLADYLRNDPSTRLELIEMLTVIDGNKRRIILSAFEQLSLEDRLSVGDALISAPHWQQRIAGINFLANSSSIDQAVARVLSNALLSEYHPAVRTALVKVLDQPVNFSGDILILDALARVSTNEPDPLVRGHALLVRTRLETDSKAIISDAISAIRTQAPELQSFGLLAINRVLDQNALSEADIRSLRNSDLAALSDEFMQPEFEHIPAELRAEFDSLVARLF